MRFFARGPILPDELLIERDAGRVVFFCGAGVSIPHGLPTFRDLTEFVIEKLSPAADSEIRRAFAPWCDQTGKAPDNAKTPLDQIFNLLQLEFGREEIGELVAMRLATKADEVSNEHRIIAKISSGRDGVLQIVTTNFDQLFEYVPSAIRCNIHQPPTLPDLQHDASISGITYLHGRLAMGSAEPHDYILSSSDFGQAYLARGWATQFVRKLLESYTVVLLGYQAEDPPVKYLLQGLNKDGSTRSHRLYAFDQGKPEEIESKWRDRGVKPIAYGPSDKHRALWDTLEAWALRAESPGRWRSSIVELAKQGPVALEPHQRGMVAHIARDTQGARLIADARPLLPIEWLFVFDQSCRLAKPRIDMFGEEASVDPNSYFGLDDDERSDRIDEVNSHSYDDDIVRWRRGDDSLDRTVRISSVYNKQQTSLPPRLLNLCRWLVRHVEQPSLAWWVAKQSHLHPHLLESLHFQVTSSATLGMKARGVWDILLEVQKDNELRSQEAEWYELLRHTARGDWTSSQLRALERASEPRFKLSAPYGDTAVMPPDSDWTQIRRKDIFKVDVEFPSLYGEKPKFNSAALLDGFGVLERNLVRAAQRLKELDTEWFRLATFYPETLPDPRNHLDAKDAYLQWFLDLFNQLADVDAPSLRYHVDAWPAVETYIFNKLRLYAWADRRLFDGKDVALRIFALEDSQLWDGESEREFLFLVRARWPDLDSAAQESLSMRFLQGPQNLQINEPKKIEEIRKKLAVAYIGWLVESGCKFSEEVLATWRELKSNTLNYEGSWSDQVANSNEVRVQAVKLVGDFSDLERCAVGEVATLALQKSESEVTNFEVHRPFLGLVKHRPVKALRALLYEERLNRFPQSLWKELIESWPDSASKRSTIRLYSSILSIPSDLLVELRHTLANWLRLYFPKLVNDHHDLAYQVFDRFVQSVIESGGGAEANAMHETYQDGRLVLKSRRTLDYAVNGPIGIATEALIKDLVRYELKPNAGLPLDFKERMKLLLSAQGEGRDHAVCIIARYALWLDEIDGEWITETVIPWFKLGSADSEPVWNGFLHGVNRFPNSILKKIRGEFLALFPGMYDWAWSDSSYDVAHGWVVLSVAFSSEDGDVISYSDARECIRHMKPRALPHVIWVIYKVGASNVDGWDNLAIPFVDGAWPRELKYRTEKNSSAWVTLLGESDEAFPRVLRSVRRFLRPIDTSHHGLYRFYQNGGAGVSLSRRFPKETLEVLDLTISADPLVAPYELNSVLEELLEVEPELLRDPRYVRLKEVEQRR